MTAHANEYHNMCTTHSINVCDVHKDKVQRVHRNRVCTAVLLFYRWDIKMCVLIVKRNLSVVKRCPSIRIK